MMDREKRRNIIRKIVRFWFQHNLAIAISVTVLFVLITVTVLCVCLYPKNSSTEDITSSYADILSGTSDGQTNPKKKNRDVVTNSATDGTEVEEIYTTQLKYNSNTKNGYMNNCIFLGDSRTVAMVSYGFVSDENVLAKIGISHPSVLGATFTQNSGKEYTVKQYLATHKAPVIYLAFGVNGMGGSDEKYQKSFKELVEAIMDMAPDSEIVIMAIGPVDDYGPYKKTCQNAWIEKYNDFLLALAEYEGIYYLDVDSVLKGDDGQVKPEYDAGDGLHYKACAYTVMLEYIIHHPVPGVSDDGEFVVKYVKPTGQFEKMVKDEAVLPNNVIISEPTDIPKVTEEIEWEGKNVTPSPTLLVTLFAENVVEEVFPSLSPSPSPSPFVQPSPSPVVDSNPTVEEPKPTINPGVEQEDPQEGEEATPTVDPEPTEEAKGEPEDMQETDPEAVTQTGE